MKLRIALEHTFKELALPNIVKSLEVDFDAAVLGHDSIHEFMWLATIFLPGGRGWHARSAFLTYHQEIFHSAHRSFYESLCGSYNTAFVLLRSSLEMILYGAFYECLAHEKFRERCNTLRRNQRGKKLVGFLEAVFDRAPSRGDDLEKVSGGIFDILAPLIVELRPPVKTVLCQLSDWGILRSIDDPITTAYQIYGRLSEEVHVLPDRTDIGRRLLLKPEKLLEEHLVMPEHLREHLDLLHQVIDVGTVVLANILRKEPLEYEVKLGLQTRLKDPDFQRLRLTQAAKRIEEFVAQIGIC